MRIQRRFITLGVAILLMALGTVVYIVVTGNECSVTMTNSWYDKLDKKDVSVEIADPSMLEVQSIDTVTVNDFTTAVVTFHALRSGDTEAIVSQSYFDEESGTFGKMEMYPRLRFRVLGTGTVIEKNFLAFNGWEIVKYETLAMLFVISVVMLISFIECFIKANYSYQMVACGGIAAYCAFMLIITLYDLYSMDQFVYFLTGISDTGYWFAVLTSPVMALLSFLMAFSNIWLLRHEGFRLQNMLGIGLAVFWFTCLAIVMNFGISFITFGSYRDAKHISYSMAYVLSFLECMLLSTIVCSFLSTTFKPPHNKDYLIILGCAIRRDGSLTPILKGRVDAAVKFEREQFAETGRHAKFVPSGGQGADEVISESEAMKRYLMEQGYPEEQIIREDKSVNTFQNIQLSRDKIMEDAGTLIGIKAAFATTNYHIFRGYILSKKHDLDAQGISAKTKWYFFPNAFLREFAGLLVDQKWRICISVFLILVIYTASVKFFKLG